ncbi:DUF881 domain-containing protein [Pseudokineococcus lusitanus]|uniref:DUF881 domain-containing protein n=1 Tax=Pseudokineococcus lusitanus TaxID=763993 RepID=UPI000F48FBE8|nr:DUF881 domain-containing protein [Pseudokineococcus lusitanus]
MAGRGSRLSRGGAAAVAGVLCLAGLLFATSAGTADGTDLREDDDDLRAVVLEESSRVATLEERVAAARAEVDALAAPPGEADAGPSEALAAAGQTAPVSGEGLVVVLADAPRGTVLGAGYDLQDTVVHSQDVQAVVNALWRGGAEGMGVMDQRVIGTTAVRCVGSTLRVQGRYYPPPYRVEAVGDPEALRAALEASPEVALYRQASDDLGLVYEVSEADLDLPAYGGTLDLSWARPA